MFVFLLVWGEHVILPLQEDGRDRGKVCVLLLLLAVGMFGETVCVAPACHCCKNICGCDAKVAEVLRSILSGSGSSSFASLE